MELSSKSFVPSKWHSYLIPIPKENIGRYSSSQVDALLEQARSERDPAVRLALYHQAEQMLVDDAAAIWISHGISRQLVKPYVHGYVLTPLSVQQSQYIYLDSH